MGPLNNLVLGSNGFVGKYLCQYLKNKGENVLEYDIVNNKDQDLRFKKLPLENIDRVYFLGWKVGGSNYLYKANTQKEQLDWNIKILSNTMDQLSNIPFVFISSQLAENCDNAYGVLKRLGEVWTGLNSGTSVRLWNVYGAFENNSIKSHVVADFVHQALKNNVIKMQTNGNEIRQFIYIEDVCDFLYSSFNNKGIYDASSLTWSSIYEMASLICSYTRCSLIRGEKEGSSLIIKNKDLVPGCSTKISLEQGIEKTVKLFKELI